MARLCRLCKRTQNLFLGPRGGLYCMDCYPWRALETQARINFLRERARHACEQSQRLRARREEERKR